MGAEPGDGHVASPTARRSASSRRSSRTRPASGSRRGMSRGIGTTARSWTSHELYDLDESGDRRASSTTPSARRRQGLLSRRAPRPEAAALPRAVQDGPGPALSILDPVPPRALRGAKRDRARRPFPRQRGAAARRPGRRGLRRREEHLKDGETLDEYGMYMTYGEAVDADEMCAGRYLPEGLVEGCRMLRRVSQDASSRTTTSSCQPGASQMDFGPSSTDTSERLARGAALGREPLARVSGHSTTALCSDRSRRPVPPS